MNILICSICNKRFNVPHNRTYTAKYCSKECMGKGYRGRTSPMKGRKHSIETRNKMTIARSGKNNPNFGKTFSKEHREKLSKARKGIHYSPDTEFRKGENMGSKHHNWKGGRYKTSNGYIFILKPFHPLANKQGYVLEHRLIVEKHLEYYLNRNQQVHHIDENRSNNNPHNLFVFSTYHGHKALHSLSKAYPEITFSIKSNIIKSK